MNDSHSHIEEVILYVEIMEICYRVVRNVG